MARIQPIAPDQLSPAVKITLERHADMYSSRISNSTATLGRSLLALETYLRWHPLYEQMEKILGKRLARLYAFAVSRTADSAAYTAHFRQAIEASGECPDKLELTASQKQLLDFGSAIVRFHGNICDHLYDSIAAQFSPDEMVVLIAFTGQMVATVLFNSVAETDPGEFPATDKYRRGGAANCPTGGRHTPESVAANRETVNFVTKPLP